MKALNPQVDILNGLLLINKPAGLTSHDVVDKVRKHFKLKKVGHTGTLDPLATGLLVLTLGKATKLTNQLISDSKEYLATCLLGKETDTQDILGKVLNQSPVPSITLDRLRKVTAHYTGEIQQIPPMFSAKKKNGKKLYQLARKGVEVEREPKTVTIYQLDIEKVELPVFQFWVQCSKGTYIRTLCHDIGKELECGGVLKSLKRTRCGDLMLSDALNLSELLTKETDFLREHLISLSQAQAYANHS